LTNGDGLSTHKTLNRIFPKASELCRPPEELTHQLLMFIPTTLTYWKLWPARDMWSSRACYNLAPLKTDILWTSSA